jgi:hypothetical protein
LLDALERLDPSFRDFWTWSRGRKKVRVPVLANREWVEEIVSRNVNRNDGDRKVIEDLGFTGTFITSMATEGVPKKEESLFLRLHCGCYSRWMSNSCVMDLPIYPPTSERVLKWEVLAELMRIMLDTMDGDNGLITSREHRELVSHPPPEEEQVGWLMYFAKEQGVVPPLPAPVRIEPVGDKGTLVILTPERLTAANPEHVELGRQVRRLLSKAGLLKDPYRALRPELPES